MSRRTDAAPQNPLPHFWRAFTASWRQKGKRKQIFPRAVRTTELPSNPSPLTFRNNQIQKSYRPLRHTQPWQPTSFSKIWTHTGRSCHTHAPGSRFSTPHIKNGQNGKLTGALWSQDCLEESGKAGGGSLEPSDQKMDKIEKKNNVFFKIVLRSQRSG